MTRDRPIDLADLALRLRQQIVRMTSAANSSHVGSCLSIVELLAVLYGRVLRFDPFRPDWPERDRFIMSKGHASAVYYAVLAEFGFFPREWLATFYQNGSRLGGHVSHRQIPGVEISTGSLGHGLSLATGMALALQRDGNPARIFALLSDGECDEGSTWEPALFAGHYRLANLTAIIDYNKIQSLGTVKEVLDLEPLADKWRAFGWEVCEIDGHDVTQVEGALASVPVASGRPGCIIAHTVKGKGVSFMEDKLLWHYRSPQDAELAAALAELGCIP